MNNCFKKNAHFKTGLILPILTVIITASACGKSNEPLPLESNPASPTDSAASLNDYIPVDGAVAFQTQCPYGTLSNPREFRVGLWDCPTSLSQVALTQPPAPLLLQADCQKKLITVRTADRRMDLTWETLPDGTFALTIPDLNAEFSEDGSGGGNCRQSLTLSFWGKLQCQDRERAQIKFESVWWLKGNPTSALNANRECGFAPTCYLHAPIQLNQCI